MKLGMWIDDAPKRVASASYVEQLDVLGLDHVALMLEKYKPGWNPRWSAKQLATLRRLAEPRGLARVLTLWPNPTANYVHGLEERLRPFVHAAQPVAIELDLEGNWKASELAGFTSLAQAGKALVSVVRALLPSEARLEVTTHIGHRETRADASVARTADALVIQAYSVARREKRPVAWADRYGPGRMQRLAISRARRVVGPEIVCGLAAYNQSWPGHAPKEAMRIAVDAARAEGVRSLRFWSSKWVIGARALVYAHAHIKQIGEASKAPNTAATEESDRDDLHLVIRHGPEGPPRSNLVYALASDAGIREGRTNDAGALVERGLGPSGLRIGLTEGVLVFPDAAALSEASAPSLAEDPDEDTASEDYDDAGEAQSDEWIERSWTSVPAHVLGGDAAYAWLAEPIAAARDDDRCPSCTALRTILERCPGHDPAPARSVPVPGNLADPDDPQVRAYEALRLDPRARLRYLVQAHLHWFGYFPELTGRQPSQQMYVVHERCGFPRYHVDGVWGAHSRTAYAAFLRDCGADGRTGWTPTKSGDRIGASDIALVESRCAAKFTRPGFSYDTDYRVERRRRGGSAGIRPYRFLSDNLSASTGPDGALDRVLEAERDVVPLRTLPFNQGRVEADFARIESLPPSACWPLRPSPSVAERWVVSYLGKTGRRHRFFGRSGRAFHAARERGRRIHGGVDLFAEYGDPVAAVADGIIVGFHNAAPLSTCFLFVFHPDLGASLNYGEVHHESLIRRALMVGDRVRAGQVIGAVGKMSSTSMLHFGAYSGRHARWVRALVDGRGLQNRLNPTALLLELRRREARRRPGHEISLPAGLEP